MIQAVEVSDGSAPNPPAVAREHPRFLAHHFGSARQQFDAGKFGMWLFLITEILFFSGLFCAYAVYRRTHPEAFAEADRFLDVSLGATNTIVLIFSSLTMACAVRAAQLGRQRQLIRLLGVTLACASIFLGIKAVEYSHKWDTGILWAKHFSPVDHVQHGRALWILSIPAACGVVTTAVGVVLAKKRNANFVGPLCTVLLIASAAYFAGVGLGKGVPRLLSGKVNHEADHREAIGMHEKAEAVDVGFANGDVPGVHSATPAHVAESEPIDATVDPVYTGIFFSIYYAMTGLHAIHILAGMGAIVWLLGCSMLGHFGPDYFGPVDYVGLYWHLVDLIWIYLFPLLYLIG